MPFPRPDRSEAGEYFFRYIDLVPEGDIRALLSAQRDEALAFFGGIPEERTGTPYAPGKWTLREVLAHVNDTERLFAFRAFWFARGLGEPLPNFDQDVAAAHTPADARSWQSHLDEFRVVRGASIALFDNLPAEAWSRAGIAAGNPFSVRALAYATVGHLQHHIVLTNERYL